MAGLGILLFIQRLTRNTISFGLLGKKTNTPKILEKITTFLLLFMTVQFTENMPRRIYKAIPEKVWINTEGDINGEYVDKRVEVNLLNK